MTRSGLSPRTVVVCPLSVARTAWVNDTRDHYPHIRIGVAAGEGAATRKRIIESKPDLLIINREVFAKSAPMLWENGYTRLAYDEASALKYHDTAISKAILAYAAKATHFYPLSGTPGPGGDWQLYVVLRCLLPDKIPASPWTFWYRYFTPQTERIRVKGGEQRNVVKGWRPKEGPLRDEFLSLLASCSRTVRKRDVIDLPPFTDSIRVVRLSAEEAAAYKLVKDEAKAVVKEHAEHPGETVRVKAESVLGKCRQLCGGWAYLAGGVTRYGFSKLNALSDLLDEMGDEQCVICVDFREDSRAIGEMLKERGQSFRALVGGGDEAGASVAAFQAGDVQHMILHPQSAGHGVTLTRSSTMIFYSLCWSPELYAQVRARIDRKGQQRAMTYYHLHAEDTVDPGVLKVVSGQVKSSDDTMRLLSELVGEKIVEKNPSPQPLDVPW